jgi:hypothetical protein
VSTRAGGLIKMAEGGGPPKMAELSAKKAGSTFDISKYIDDEGRLVGGTQSLYTTRIELLQGTTIDPTNAT